MSSYLFQLVPPFLTWSGRDLGQGSDNPRGDWLSDNVASRARGGGEDNGVLREESGGGVRVGAGTLVARSATPS